MKFGLEAEKFLYDLQTRMPSEGVFSFIDGLSDFQGYAGSEGSPKITNEFVLNMVEIGTTPSTSPVEVLKDYLLHYLMIKKVATREQVSLVPMGSLPINFLPHMVSKWSYYLQNSILSGKKLNSWMMDIQSPLKAAGNCAGIHVHAEVETPHEFLFSNRELVDKFNMGLMMTPMIAFSSSPYFYGEHRAKSMRGLRYYFDTYRNFPLNGNLPPIMSSSADVLNYFQKSIHHWVGKGLSLGFKKDEIDRLMAKKGANWNPVRWNRAWNTIEIRCLESDSVELDCAKFIWICHAMKRLDLKGEALKCRVLNTERALDEQMIQDVLQVNGKEVTILPAHAMNDLFERAVIFGTKDTLVEAYLHRLCQFAKMDISEEEMPIFEVLEKALNGHRTTAEWMLTRTGGASEIENEQASEIIEECIQRQDTVIRNLRPMAPDIFSQLEEMLPHI